MQFELGELIKYVYSKRMMCYKIYLLYQILLNVYVHILIKELF